MIVGLLYIWVAACTMDNTDYSMADDQGNTSHSSWALGQANDWFEIAPGVWERQRPEGGSERLGFGTEGFEFALDLALQEHTMVLEEIELNGMAKSASKRLRAIEELIAYLQASLAENEKLGLYEPSPLAPPEDDVQTASTGSQYVCAGTYNFDVSFQLGMAGGSVTSQAGWSEFGPFAPYTKTLHTYAYATYEGRPYPAEDSDQYGPFSGQCCVGVESSASAYPTFFPELYGSTYLSVTNGCYASRFYSASYP